MLDFVLGKNHAARAVLGIFDLDQSGWRIDHMTRGLACSEELTDTKRASSPDLGELNTGVGAPGAGFVPYRVTLTADDDVVARPG